VRALLLSAYDAGSHRYWRRALGAMLGDWQWRVLSLPPRHFSWRVRGNPLHWALRERQALEAGADLLIATSMVDLATLRGLVPSLARLPSLLYFHENQFDYPAGRGRHGPLEAQMVSLYSALAADRLAFNSAYNRDTFLAGVEALLRKLPDFAPAETAGLLAARSEVLPVPLLPAPALAQARSPWRARGPVGARALRLVWPGRLEYDKGGEMLLEVLTRLESAGLDYELALVGQAFREVPPVFQEIASRLAHRLVHLGWLESPADYQRLLAEADVVLSTALHEFQGIAVLEAVAQGCLPALPARQAYPGMYPARFLYASSPERPAAEARSAADKVLELAAAWRQGELAPPPVTGFSLEALAPRYRALFSQLAACGMASGGDSR
jgi:glycosyltransferase involved in cell wall biosynthesis